MSTDIRAQESLVSVIIPTYNRPVYLTEAIKSAVGQTSVPQARSLLCLPLLYIPESLLPVGLSLRVKSASPFAPVVRVRSPLPLRLQPRAWATCFTRSRPAHPTCSPNPRAGAALARDLPGRGRARPVRLAARPLRLPGPELRGRHGHADRPPQCR